MFHLHASFIGFAAKYKMIIMYLLDLKKFLCVELPCKEHAELMRKCALCVRC